MRFFRPISPPDGLGVSALESQDCGGARFRSEILRPFLGDFLESFFFGFWFLVFVLG